jgi:hypothetical protein
MALDVSRFEKLVVADTCSVWNVLSSRVLHRHGVAVGCCFSITTFGLYECLFKPRKTVVAADVELKRRLEAARVAGQFQSYPLDVEDLQDVALLERRRRLSKGELAAIAFARKTRQAFLTDDQGARALAASAMDPHLVQTTPHLVGWLVFIGRIGDSDIGGIIEEHESLKRPLRPHFRAMYEEGMRCRLMTSSTS